MPRSLGRVHPHPVDFARAIGPDGGDAGAVTGHAGISGEGFPLNADGGSHQTLAVAPQRANSTSFNGRVSCIAWYRVSYSDWIFSR